MRQRLIAGNWKMHGSRAFVAGYAAALKAQPLPDGVALLLLPPTVYLVELARALAPLPVALGVQNVHADPEGAFTGEMAAEMAADIGASWALAGHSERRAHCGETDAQVAAKVTAARRAGLNAILCVGETLAERDAGSAEAVVSRQLEAVVQTLGDDELHGLVVAYEPVWAIGTGRTATPAQAGDMHGHIRARMAALAGRPVADKVQILYGGSVKPDNAVALLAQPDIDGALVGGASLDPAAFAHIAAAG